MVERWPAASRTRRRAEDRASVESERREHQLFVLGVKAAYDAICIEEAELERQRRDRIRRLLAQRDFRREQQAHLGRSHLHEIQGESSPRSPRSVAHRAWR